MRRNYPILGNIRYLVEGIRPEIRQYLLESDSDALPFSRAQRSLVYSRAKNETADKPFGTLIDVYQSGFEFIGHSMRPAPLSDPNGFRVTVGGPQCTQPYSASIFNISAMSFGSLSANAIRALNQGAKLGNFAHDTGEGSISPYHREHGGDIEHDRLRVATGQRQQGDGGSREPADEHAPGLCPGERREPCRRCHIGPLLVAFRA